MAGGQRGLEGEAKEEDRQTERTDGWTANAQEEEKIGRREVPHGFVG